MRYNNNTSQNPWSRFQGFGEVPTAVAERPAQSLRINDAFMTKALVEVRDLTRAEMRATYIGLAAAAAPLVYQAVPGGKKQGWMWAVATGAALGFLTHRVLLRVAVQTVVEDMATAAGMKGVPFGRIAG